MFQQLVLGKEACFMNIHEVRQPCWETKWTAEDTLHILPNVVDNECIGCMQHRCSMGNMSRDDDAPVPWPHVGCWGSQVLRGLSAPLQRWMCLKRQCWAFPPRSPPRSLSSSSRPSYTADPCGTRPPWRCSSPQSHTGTCRRSSITDQHPVTSFMVCFHAIRR